MITKICLVFLTVFAEFLIGVEIYVAIQLFKAINEETNKEVRNHYKLLSVCGIILFSFVGIILPFIIFFSL